MHSIFGTKHLIILAISLAAMVLGVIFARKWPMKKLAKTMLNIGLVSEFIKVFYYIMANEATHGGILPKTDLPFHLCSIQIIFIVILNLSANERLRRILLSFMVPSCLLGGAAAILIPTSSALNSPVITVQYFLFHIALMVLALRIATSDEIRLTVKDYFGCLKFLVGLFFFATYINSLVYDGVSNINFMYVASPPQSGLPYLTEEHGWLVYVIHYAFLVVLCVTLCYLKPIVTAIRSRSKRNKK